ncbi:MAG: IS5 family transposase [Verrucomicrobia bacterium]|nr:MAG: IS5 family transposase [Verrucomicrobiota bacterium]
MNSIQHTFFGDHAALEALSQHGDRLVELDRHIKWEPLVAVAEKIWRGCKEKKAACGPKPWATEIMLRVLVLKRLYNLSDEQTEYQLRDRLSFQRFSRLGLGEAVPDSRTIWLYADQVARGDGARELFEAFNRQLVDRGLLVKEGVMVDATFVEVPRQRNTREENEKIREGQTPEKWENQPRKLAQKDEDARWAKKNDQTFYGYKDHVKVGAKTKIILAYTVTAASTHDSQAMPGLIAKGDGSVHADSAYTGEPIAADLRAKSVRNHIHEKGNAAAPLSEDQKNANRRKSRTRARVEHTFAFMEKSLGGIYHRCIGLVRNKYQIGMMNLCYNLCLCVQLLTGRTVGVA